MINAVRQVTFVLPKNIVVRSIASASQASDPIQKLFIDKIREYSNKAKTAPDGLVDSNADLAKKLSDDMDRVANLYGIKNVSDIANLGLKFEETMQLDSINLRK